MKPLIAALASGSLALLAATSVHAQAVLSADTYFTSESQVLTIGTEVWGGATTFNGQNTIASGSRTLADGVSFDSIFNNANFVSTDLGSGITVKTDGSYYCGHSNVSGFSDPKLNSILEGDAVGNYGQIFVDGLVAGQTYVIQVFANMTQGADIGGGSNNSTSVYSGSEVVTDETQGGSTTLSYGQTYDPINETYSGTGVYSITDTFVAQAGGQEFLFLGQPPQTSAPVLVGEIQVRQLPEPSVYGLLGLGLLALVAIGRFRKLTAWGASS
jgi:hypothetical protein